MGVDFTLTRGWGRRGRRREQPDDGRPALPEVDARFAASEFPRFLAKVAEDAGLGDAWAAQDHMRATQLQHIHDNMAAIGKAAALRAMGKAHQFPPPPPPGDPRVLELREQLDAWQKDLTAKADVFPILHFLLNAIGPRPRLTSAQCAAAEPALRAIAEQWEPAPEGHIGWREQAIKLCDAMRIAAADSEVWLRIST